MGSYYAERKEQCNYNHKSSPRYQLVFIAQQKTWNEQRGEMLERYVPKVSLRMQEQQLLSVFLNELEEEMPSLTSHL